MGLKPASVHCHTGVNSTLSIMNISETDRPIAIIFYLKHYWGSGKAALGFAADQIRTQDPGDNKTYLPPTHYDNFLCQINHWDHLHSKKTIVLKT